MSNLSMEVLGLMAWRVRKPFRVFARSASLRRRVAYSLAIVRLILVPVIFLAVYYLFAMSWIVDRIVSVDAPVASLAGEASTEMLEARRAERNYFLLRDPDDLTANQQALAALEQTIVSCRELQPAESPTTKKMLSDVTAYRTQFNEAVSHVEEPPEAPAERVQSVVETYQKQLAELLRSAGRHSRAHLMQEIRTQLDSFDQEITNRLEAEDPALRQATTEMRESSRDLLQLSKDIENRSWDRVQRDHEDARRLVRRAEWVLGIVSLLTLILSVTASFLLPRQVVKPLLNLKEAVDHAAAGNYEIEFDVEGDGEVVALANSVRRLIAHLREKEDARLTAGPR
ncbi:MAG: HAMP domain-containing protein [Terriglobia bacterium]